MAADGLWRGHAGSGDPAADLEICPTEQHSRNQRKSLQPRKISESSSTEQHSRNRQRIVVHRNAAFFGAWEDSREYIYSAVFKREEGIAVTDEAGRLRALRKYRILDTAPEQAFDDLTLIASQICGTPIALISLVDENRQWFKSRVGLEVKETARSVSFCTHAIQQNDTFLVPDALEDPRCCRWKRATCPPQDRSARISSVRPETRRVARGSINE